MGIVALFTKSLISPGQTLAPISNQPQVFPARTDLFLRLWILPVLDFLAEGADRYGIVVIRIRIGLGRGGECARLAHTRIEAARSSIFRLNPRDYAVKFTTLQSLACASASWPPVLKRVYEFGLGNGVCGGRKRKRKSAEKGKRERGKREEKERFQRRIPRKLSSVHLTFFRPQVDFFSALRGIPFHNTHINYAFKGKGTDDVGSSVRFIHKYI
ncbi:hypothetical protein DFH06DRAFT_1123771 [Mycena polygramma]|nr:hypothetical protein DFH06DRAFT_1123771 [Mycena polygramma]